MCGIVGVVRRRARRTPPDPAALAAELAGALGALDSSAPIAERLASAASLVEAVDAALRGAPGVRALLGAPNVSAALEEPLGAIWLALDAIETGSRPPAPPRRWAQPRSSSSTRR